MIIRKYRENIRSIIKVFCRRIPVRRPHISNGTAENISLLPGPADIIRTKVGYAYLTITTEEYTDLGNPHIGDKTNTSFSSQINVCPQSTGKRYVHRLCRPVDTGKDGYEDVRSGNKGMERHFKDYKPDHSPKKAEPLPGKLLKHTEKTCKSTYVWLPIEWDGRKAGDPMER